MMDGCCTRTVGNGVASDLAVGEVVASSLAAYTNIDHEAYLSHHAVPDEQQ